MEDFVKLEKLFEKAEQEVQELLDSITHKLNLIDTYIARVLGIRQPEIVLLVRKLLESYSWFLEQTIGQKSRLIIEKYELTNQEISRKEKKKEKNEENETEKKVNQPISEKINKKIEEASSLELKDSIIRKKVQTKTLKGKELEEVNINEVPKHEQRNEQLA